jgi:hypothetical protein
MKPPSGRGRRLPPSDRGLSRSKKKRWTRQLDALLAPRTSIALTRLSGPLCTCFLPVAICRAWFWSVFVPLSYRWNSNPACSNDGSMCGPMWARTSNPVALACSDVCAIVHVVRLCVCLCVRVYVDHGKWFQSILSDDYGDVCSSLFLVGYLSFSFSLLHAAHLQVDYDIIQKQAGPGNAKPISRRWRFSMRPSQCVIVVRLPWSFLLKLKMYR